MEQIIKFNGKVDDFGPNFLYKSGKIFIMDTQMASFWTWLQKIDIKQQYNFLLVSANLEYNESRLKEYNEELSVMDITTITLHDLLNNLPGNECMSIGDMVWKNSLCLVNTHYPELITNFELALHGDNDQLEFQSYYIHDVPYTLDLMMKTHGDNKWIVNVDMSYFFSRKKWLSFATNEFDEYTFRMLSDDYIETIGQLIKKYWNEIEVLTVTLNPYICGLDNSVAAAKVFLKQFDIQLTDL